MSQLFINPQQPFYDDRGRPLKNGTLIFGEENKDPLNFPRNVQDQAGNNIGNRITLSTSGTQPSDIFLPDSNYSLRIEGRRGYFVQIFDTLDGAQLFTDDVQNVLDSTNTFAAIANSKGNWSNLTGALAVPASVYHNGENWQLLNDLTDVTASEPGVSSDWVMLPNATRDDINDSQEEIVDGSIFPTNGSDVANGDTVPVDTEYLRFNGQILEMVPAASGVVSNLTSSSVTIGTTSVMLFPWVRSAAIEPVQSALEVTVGLNGDYQTINAALVDLSHKRLVYIDPSEYDSNTVQALVKIRLLTGFVMSEQVLVQGVDLSWIEIVSDNTEVTIDRASLTIDLSGRFPAFGARNNGTLPIINTLFNMNTNGDAALRDGVFVTNQSKVHVLSGKGVKNAGERGLHVSNNSQANARGSIFTGATTAGFRAGNQSAANIRDADFSDAGTNGLQITGSMVIAGSVTANDCGSCGCFAQSSWVNIQDSTMLRCQTGTDVGYTGALEAFQGSNVFAAGSNFGDSGRDGVVCRDAKVVLYSDIPERTTTATGAAVIGLKIEAGDVVATMANFSGAGTWGLESENASVVAAVSANFNNCGATGTGGAVTIRGGFANLRSSTGIGATGRAMLVDRGANVSCTSVNYSGASSSGLDVQGGSTVSANSANFSGAPSLGISANNGSHIAFRAGNAQRGGSPSSNDIIVTNGSIISANDATGGTSQTVNTISSNGIIFG